MQKVPMKTERIRANHHGLVLIYYFKDQDTTFTILNGSCRRIFIPKQYESAVKR